jgi:Protein of unknown function (DUF2892)
VALLLLLVEGYEDKVCKIDDGMLAVFSFCWLACSFYQTIFLTIKLFNMKKNMGNADRIIRLLLAAVFAYLYFGGIVTGTLGIVLVVLGAVFVLTSLVSFCPLYTLVGLNTCPRKAGS